MFALITIFLIITWAWLTYWIMVRPVILDSVEDELVRMKFSVQWSFIQDEPGAHSEAAQRLLNKLKVGKIIRFISFSHVVVLYANHRSEIRALAAKERASFESAPLWIRDHWQRHRTLSVKAALANSPTWWIPLSALLLARVFSKQAEEWWEGTETAATNKLMTECPV